MTIRHLTSTFVAVALGLSAVAGTAVVSGIGSASADRPAAPLAPPGDYHVSMQLQIYNVEDFSVEVSPNYPANHCSYDWSTFAKPLADNNIEEVGFTANATGSCSIQDSKGHWFVQVYDPQHQKHGRYEVWLDEGRMGLYRAGVSTLEAAPDIAVEYKADPAHGVNYVRLTRS